jgi:hypothetical protein
MQHRLLPAIEKISLTLEKKPDHSLPYPAVAEHTPHVMPFKVGSEAA